MNGFFRWHSFVMFTKNMMDKKKKCQQQTVPHITLANYNSGTPSPHLPHTINMTVHIILYFALHTKYLKKNPKVGIVNKTSADYTFKLFLTACFPTELA